MRKRAVMTIEVMERKVKKQNQKIRRKVDIRRRAVK